MTVRDTMDMSRQRKQQVRSFALIWTGITLMMGAAAFVAIYGATGVLVHNRSSLPPAPISVAAAAAIAATQQNAAPAAAASALPTIGAIASNTPLGVNPPAAVALQVTATPASVQPAAPTAAPVQPTKAPVAAVTIPAVKDTAFDLGIQVQENLDPKTYDLWMQMVGDQLKLNWMKSQVRWRDIEKTKGSPDFGALDTVMSLASKHNIKVLLSIVTAPDWAREPGVKIVPDRQGPPANPQDYVNFVTTLVKRYPGQIHAIEVWNEQNLDREWDSPKGLVAAQYVALLKATNDAVKAIDPNILILSGALSPTGTSNPPKWFDDFVYMDQLIKAGMLNTVDCVGAHHNGYNIGPSVKFQDGPRDPKSATAKFRGPFDNPNHLWSFRSTLEGYAAKIKAAGSALKLCITEFGWPSIEDIKTADGKQAPPPRGFEFAADNTLAQQADYTNQAINMMNGTDPTVPWDFVRLAFIWNLNYGAQIGWDPKNDNVPYSILGPNFGQRPVWQKITDQNFRGKARSQ